MEASQGISIQDHSIDCPNKSRPSDLEAYNNHYSMKAARRRSPIYMNDDEGIYIYITLEREYKSGEVKHMHCACMKQAMNLCLLLL